MESNILVETLNFLNFPTRIFDSIFRKILDSVFEKIPEAGIKKLVETPVTNFGCFD